MTTTISGLNGVSKVATGAVDATALAAGAVGTAALANLAVTPQKLSGISVLQANQTPLNAVSKGTWTHGLGAIPVGVQLEFVCLTAELGYSVNDVISAHYSNGTFWSVPHIICDATTIQWATPSPISWVVLHKSTNAASNPTPANWAWRFRAFLA